MQKLNSVWILMLGLILLMGAMPLILAGIGYALVLYVENFGSIEDLFLLDRGMRLLSLAYYGFATLPAALISSAIWMFAKSVASRPSTPPDAPRKAQ